MQRGALPLRNPAHCPLDLTRRCLGIAAVVEVVLDDHRSRRSRRSGNEHSASNRRSDQRSGQG
jgi:hypothetical protein